MNRLYYGDCLTVMQEHMNLGSVDLIYLDPPFNSNREYNAIYKDETGRPLPAQIDAFCDMWEMDEERERVLRMMPVLMREAGLDDQAAQFWRLWMNALRHTQPRLLAYLSYMVERLLPMKGLLKPTGSIFLHCDPTASHYIKVMMDAIFGHANFKNEIIWSYKRYTAKSNRFQREHDVILWYGKSTPTFNVIYEPYGEKSGRRDSHYKQDEEGKWFRWQKRRGQDPYKVYLSEGRRLGDVWQISHINASANERMGYATQKPLALLNRIIKAGSNEGEVVFDPFCGCATTLEAAHHLDRQWIGIDIAIHAIKRVAAVRLRDRLALKEGRDFTIEGVPQDVAGARDLWSRDPYHFQKWAVEQVDGFVTAKRTADGGVDGRLYFGQPNSRDLSSMAIEVKGGKHVGIKEVRELRGVLDTDVAELAGLIVMEPLGATKERNLTRFMAEAGDMDVLGVKYSRMQVLTVADILDGKRFHTPSVAGRGLAQPNLI